jgi:hypothetical protein
MNAYRKNGIIKLFKRIKKFEIFQYRRTLPHANINKKSGYPLASS